METLHVANWPASLSPISTPVKWLVRLHAYRIRWTPPHSGTFPGSLSLGGFPSLQAPCSSLPTLVYRNSAAWFEFIIHPLLPLTVPIFLHSSFDILWTVKHSWWPFLSTTEPVRAWSFLWSVAQCDDSTCPMLIWAWKLPFSVYFGILPAQPTMWLVN